MFFWSVLAQVTTDLSPNGEEEVESRTKKAMPVENNSASWNDNWDAKRT
jgi:hypothetical protein